jgi:tetratricopeptide (TPR) repeat protein
MLNANLLLTVRLAGVMLQCPRTLHIRGPFERSLCQFRLGLRNYFLRELIRHLDVRVNAPAFETPWRQHQMIHLNGATLWARSALVTGILLLCAACSRNFGLPKPGSATYRNLVRAFNVGLAGLQSGEDVRAKKDLTLATRIAPGEPASWANLGILAVRQQELDEAYKDLEKARSLAPDNSRIEQLLGDLESRRGNLPEAIQHLKRAVLLDGTNIKALYLLAEQTERQGTGSSDGEALDTFRKLLNLNPGNTAVLLEVARLSAKLGNRDVLKSAMGHLRQQSLSWPAEAKKQMQTLDQSVSGANPRSAALQVAFLRNILLRVPEFRRASQVVKTPAVFVGEPFLRFIKSPWPMVEAAAADSKLAFTSQSIPNLSPGPVSWMRAVWLDDSGKPSLLWANDGGVHIQGGATLSIPAAVTASLSPNCVALADLNYDFKVDIVVAGPGGVFFFQQETPQHFVDVTAQARLPAGILKGSYSGAWPLDVDLDGDLDIVLAVNDGEPVVLRNNGDGTFGIVKPFAGMKGGVSFATADIDGDGDPDVAMVGVDGKLNVFMNERFGHFQARAVPRIVADGVAALAAADVNSDGSPDFVILKLDGTIVRLSDKDGGAGWETSEIAKAGTLAAGTASISLADFDNNGRIDLLIAGRDILLGDERGFTRLSAGAGAASASVADMDGDGRLDIAGLSDGKPVVLTNHGAKNYHWQVIRTRAAAAHGDQRINSFGLGGEIEIRAGLLTEKQIITSPVLHFGLGEHTGTDLARITWPNGLIQVEFELSSNQSILATQRLKGSCPSLFAWDGKQMRFVKDGAPWSPALGLHINAQRVSDIQQTEEWFKIPGDQVAPRNGDYDLRITAELWETFYIDHYSLLVVDHPKGTDIYSDERFAVPSPKLKVYTTKTALPFAGAVDDRGNDVSKIVLDTDQRYLDTFGRGQYQGVTRNHWVELDLPNDAPRTGPLYLIAEGWTHPTDATVNVALGQGGDPAPQSLSIEVPDSNGRWATAKANLGFPAGKLKTAVLDITNVFRPGAPRKLRLQTNMEIYWDRLAWAPGASNDLIRIQKVGLSAAELRRRGFSVITAADPSSPEIPHYDQLGGTSQKWRDLEGYYTRFGDIRELLDKVDDRYVIVCAGDEMRLRFAAPRPPPNGWVRDLIMIGNGWIKDGDYNSTFSQTVLPLPYHEMKAYTRPPDKLEDDPAYRMHPRDWETFHTRYVTPEVFRTELWNKQ